MRMGNLERNTYVREQIETAAVKLFMEKDMKDISINDIVNEAGVSRISFYRNYEDKEDILKTYIGRMILDWHQENEERFTKAKEKTGNDNVMLSSLFGLLKSHEALFERLKEKNMFYIFRDAFLSLYGPKEEYPNGIAYVQAFAFYGIAGWIEEWVKRGMQESEKEMMSLLEAMQKNQQ